ncbi:MAG TPA: PAS domain S-box protein [Thermoanaerobaculia bacterium]|jgi:diguanylate cyclase (GGDEF)-like protein/PAS domain S-box-containing protein
MTKHDERLLALGEETPMVLFAVDNAGVITRLGGKGLETLGVNPAETVGRSAWELYASHTEALALLRRALEGETFTATAEVSGAIFEVHFAPNFDAGGNRIGVVGVALDVANSRRAESALRDSEARNAAILQSALDAIVTMDREGKIIEFNPAAEHLFGYTRAEALGKFLGDLIIPARLRQRHREGLARYLATGEGPILGKRIEMPALRADGTEFPAELTVSPVSGDGPPMFTGFVRDITDRKYAEELSRLLAAIVESSDDAIVGKTLDGTIISWNQGAERIYGYTAEEAIGRPISLLAPPDRQNEMVEVLERIGRGERVDHYETERVRRDGQKIHVSLTISPVKDPAGRITGASAISRDITERTEARAKVEHLAFHDALTGLPNRLLFNDRLELAVAQAHRNERPLAVFFLDLDRFKFINDSLGHPVGDELLRVVADRVIRCVREGDTVARLGGDEFLVLLPGVAAEQDAAVVGRKILEAIRLPVQIQERELSVTMSIGIALYPADGLDAESLVSNADRAMYRAKVQGRDNCQFCSRTVDAGARRPVSPEGRRK